MTALFDSTLTIFATWFVQHGIDPNKCGIILNFVAAFLLTPKLLGLRKLQRLERFIKGVVARTVGFIRQRLLRSHVRVSIDKSRPLPTIVAIGGLGWMTLRMLEAGYRNPAYRYVGWLLGLSFLEFLVSLAFSSQLPPNKPVERETFLSRSLNIYENLLKSTKMPLKILVITVGLPILTVMFFVEFLFITVSGSILIPALPLAAILSALTKRFEGESQLPGVLIRLGVIVFIAGNVLQFIAVYVPKA